MRCPEAVWERADRIEGWLTREEADLLYRYARAPWCEIGTYKGRSATVLTAKGHGYCVDLFEEWYAVRNGDLGRFSGPHCATLVKGDFRDVADQVPDGLEFLYLDADHSYEGTRDAWKLYAPKVKLGGHIAIHDALELHPGELEWPEVNEFAFGVDSLKWRLVAAAHRVVVFRRVR